MATGTSQTTPGGGPSAPVPASGGRTQGTVREYVDRGNNLFGIGVIGVIGAGEITAITSEGGVRGGLDEAVISVIALAGLVWYFRFRLTRSVVPALVIGAALLMKLIALVIEDPDDRGDDIGLSILLVTTLVSWLVIYIRTARIEAV